jgi:hypothetical protein
MAPAPTHLGQLLKPACGLFPVVAYQFNPKVGVLVPLEEYGL